MLHHIIRPHNRGLRLVDMRWLRLVGSLKLQVSFAEYRLFYTAFLQRRPIILRSLLVIATPYPHHPISTQVCLPLAYIYWYIYIYILIYMILFDLPGASSSRYAHDSARCSIYMYNYAYTSIKLYCIIWPYQSGGFIFETLAQFCSLTNRLCCYSFDYIKWLEADFVLHKVTMDLTL